MSTPPADSSFRANRPGMSLPTRPTTAAFRPIPARSTATFEAQPPIAGEMLSAITRPPASGTCVIGEQIKSATMIPAQRQSYFFAPGFRECLRVLDHSHSGATIGLSILARPDGRSIADCRTRILFEDIQRAVGAQIRGPRAIDGPPFHHRQ